MSKLLALIAVTVMAADASDRSVLPSGDVRRLLELTLKEERRLHPAADRPRTCLGRNTYAITFYGDRYQRQAYLEEIDRGRTEPFLRKAYEDSARPNYRWRSATSSLESPEFLELPHLNQVASKLIISPPPQGPEIPIGLEGLSDFPICRKKNDPRPTLGLSAPEFSGDYAFVGTGYGCGMLCGNGLLYAYRKSTAGWQLVAVADTWVS